MRRGLEKAAIPFAALALAGAAPRTADGGEAPKTINSGTSLESRNLLLQNVAVQIGEAMIKNGADLTPDKQPGKIKAVIKAGSKAMGLMVRVEVIMGEKKGGSPDPSATDAIKFEHYNPDDGDRTITLSKGANIHDIFSEEPLWRAEMCVEPTHPPNIPGCWSNEPITPLEFYLDPVKLATTTQDASIDAILFAKKAVPG